MQIWISQKIKRPGNTGHQYPHGHIWPPAVRACGIRSTTVPTRPACLPHWHDHLDSFRLLSVEYQASLATSFTGSFNKLMITKLPVECSQFCHNRPVGCCGVKTDFTVENGWRSANSGPAHNCQKQSNWYPKPIFFVRYGFEVCEPWGHSQL